MGDRVYSSPAVGKGGVIQVGSGDGNVYALRSNGTLHWSYSAKDEVLSSHAVGRWGEVYIGSGYWDQNFYCIDYDGRLLWTYWMGEVINSPVIDADGKIYVTTSESPDVYCLNGNGSFSWSYRNYSSYISCSPAIGDGGKIFTSSYYGVFVYNSDGAFDWSYRAGSYVYSS